MARLAGVGRAAVSNWRRRHADFPRPVGGTDTSPSFALPEVEDWLRGQGKLAEVPLRERVWQQISGRPDGAVPALVAAGAALLLVHERPTDWPALAAHPDPRMAELLPPQLARVLTDRLGPRHPLGPFVDALGPADMPLLRAAAELAAELQGARAAFEFLLGRHLDANPRQYTLTPEGPAALMAALAGPAARTVLDPACGTGALLRAVPGAVALHAQDLAPDLAALTALRLALAHSGPATGPGPAVALHVAAGDALRADAFPHLAADAVLCHPPFNERGWGHEELAYDPRWEYGFPARTESELAWVQHALARLRDGGTAVLLMPPAVAARRSGRRIRADLLRRGALRAVIALPPGAAPPYGIPLHLWVLRRPEPGGPPPADLLLIDAAGLTADGRDRADWAALHTAVLDTWTAHTHAGHGPGAAAGAETPGFSRRVPVVELLDDDVDLTPARHLPAAGDTRGVDELDAVRERLDRTLALAADLAPAAPTTPAAGPHGPAGPARFSSGTIGELARAGALVLRTGTGAGSPPPGTTDPVVLTEHDLHAGAPASGTLQPGPDEPVLVRAGDVILPTLGGGGAVRVADDADAGAVLGRNLHLLRPDPAALDPWFLAGFLRGTTNRRQASSHASTATRLDVRRLTVPRLPLAEQARYGARFRELAAFEAALRLAGRLGEQLVRGLHDGLADGTVTPD
ncbi:N-6 DNA methylase [Streptomyces sp. BI20]|uniref:N-6 DNA methylase n=1 Tax=Streptomyces sp. BI20 TaxID=3403460 RepID=UPI003C73EFF8